MTAGHQPGTSPPTGGETAGAPAARSGARLALALLAAAALLLVVRLVEFSDRHLVVDDAYISFRYAQNLAAGEGLVFNPGERVEGYTNFLWTALLAAGAAAGLDLVRLSQVLGGLFALGTAGLLFLVARRLLPELPARPVLLALPSLLWAALGTTAWLAGSGMESVCFVFWVLLASYLLFVADRAVAGGVAFALAAMTRPEGGLYGLIAGAVCVLGALRAPSGAARRRGWLRCVGLAGAFAAVYVPYFLWRYRYYGFLLPNTFYAKVGDMTAERVERGWDMLVDLVLSWNVLPLLVFALVALGSPRGRRSGLPMWSFLAAAACYFVVVGGDLVSFFGPRFLLPALPMVLLLAALGVGVASRLAPGRRARAALASTLAAGLVAWSVWLTAPRGAEELRWLAYEMEGWERLGRWMASSVPADASVAVGAAGIVPYYSGAPTIDMYGLVDANIAHMPPRETGFVRVAHEKFAPGYVMRRRPDYIVTYLNPDGRPATGGLARLDRRLWACYRWELAVRVAEGAPEEAPWLLPADAFSPRLWAQGYRAALLARRDDPGARCRF